MNYVVETFLLTSFQYSLYVCYYFLEIYCCMLIDGKDPDIFVTDARN